ncbi:aldehyde:ferredoxin oxidoreductase [Syntrophus gentianae]|uniref:Aldehyde:ferredoxin oxidoreductase n=1 Tax=Syntrophus gentianae TaxID=43775 RepID=A0A1H7YY57_9BACT|nr:aldehyde ferredoxin oxidoreductase N-terminal domain-containing protein [Syntrophus gentianae]SEM51242.1 aldehyde:ferredoxin oxidoreductase [Syntrophus gentianae]
MRYGETGYNLEIDLATGNIERVETYPKSVETLLGGQGTALKILWDRVPPDVEPFSPDNLLIFSAGLLHGTPVPGANRTSVSTINPQSNLYVHSGFGGFFGPELKHAGYDQIIIRGKSPRLVYLWIHNDKVEIRDASQLTGKSAREVAVLIQQELKDSKIQVAAIGLAGENRVYQSTIEHSNSSASQGAGTIMGDKGIKAIAVRGNKEINIARPADLWELCLRQYQRIYDNPYCGDVFLREEDDSWHANHFACGDAQGRARGYWNKELQDEWTVRVESVRTYLQWENYSQVMEEMEETVVETSKMLRGTACYNCPKECHQAISLPNSRKYFLKSYCKLAYAKAAYEDTKLNYDVLCAIQDYGLDEFAMHHVLSFVVELCNAGILTDADLPEFPAEVEGRMIYLAEKIAQREGVGDKLAKGIYEAARQIGKGAEAHVRNITKKIEQAPLRQEKVNYPYFLMYATGDKTNITQVEGSFPQQPIPDPEERKKFVECWEAAPEKFKKWFLEWEPGQQLPIEAAVNIAAWNEVMHYVDDAVGMCTWLSSFRGQYGGSPPYHLYNLPKYIHLAAGIELDPEKLWEIGKRNRNLVRAINVRRGMRRADEQPPEAHWKERDPEAEQQLLDAYYEFKGWTRDGIPTRETLDSLGLDYVSEDLVKREILKG